MEVKTNFAAKQAFILNVEHVRKIWGTFEAARLKVHASAMCSDGMHRKFETCDQLSGYENSRRSSIESLEISARSLEPYTIAKISFGERFSAPISFSMSGEEDCVSETRSKIADVIEDTKAWYSWLSTFELFYFWMPLILLTLMILNLTTPSSGGAHQALPLKAAFVSLAILLTATGVLVLSIWTISWLKRRYFPVSTFSIGQGQSRHHHLEQVRWVVIVGLAIGVISSVVTTLVTAT